MGHRKPTTHKPGETHNYLELQEPVWEGRWYWKAKCVCGEITKKREDHIIKGVATSCGCKSKSRARGKDHVHWTGVGDISGAFFANLRSQAEHRSIPFDLTIEFVWALYEQRQGKCALSGLPLAFPTGIYGTRRCQGTASLDRIDPELTYTEGNVQWVHKDVNAMKRDFSQQEYIHMCALVVKHQQQAMGVDIDPDEGLFTRDNVEKPALVDSSAGLLYNGETKSVSEWSRETGLAITTIIGRLRMGWTVEDTLSQSAKDRKVTLGDKTMSMTDWAKETGIPFATIYSRIKNGWTIERAITTPVRERQGRKSGRKPITRTKTASGQDDLATPLD